MSAELITNLLSVGPLGIGGSTTVAHGIRTNNLGPTIPNVIVPNRSTGIVVTAVTTTQITFTNSGGVDGDSALFLVEYIHSTQNGVPSLQWWWQGGPIGSGTGTAMRLDSISTDNIQVYVDGINGNDSNDGLAPATALKTVGAVYRKFPVLTIDGARLTINIAGTGGFGASATGVLNYTESTLLAGGGMSFSNSYKYKCAEMVAFTPATGPATAAFDVTPATVSGKRTTLAFTTAAPGWTAHDLQGQFARILRAGVPVFAELPIADNTTNQIFIDTTGLVGVVLNTDTFEVVQPSVVVIGIDDGPFTGTFMTKIQGTGAGTAYNDAFTTNQEPMTFERMGFGGDEFAGVYLDSNGVGFDRCSFDGSAGSWFRGLGVAMVNTIVEYTMYWGCSSADDETVPNFAPGTINKTVFVQLLLYGGPLLVGGITTNGLGATSNGYFCAQRNVSVYQATSFVGAAIHVGPNSVFYMDPVGSPDTGYDGALQGSSTNSTLGIRCIGGGKARVGSNTAGLTTITGTSGTPLQLDGTGAIAYGTGAGDFEEAVGYNGNFTFKNAGTSAAPVGDGGSRIYTDGV